MSVQGSLYADLAGYYDRFCAQVDYAEQGACAQRVFGLFAQSSGHEYLDLACGTGQLLLVLQQAGFAVHGLDNSAAMLERAAERCPTAQLQLCDLAAFEQQQAFDLITCLLYSLHYSHPTSALRETLRRSYVALKPGGVLLFNTVDARGIQNDAGITTRIEEPGATLSFQSAWHYRGAGEVLDLHLTITRESEGQAERWHDHHTMTAVTIPQLQALLVELGFQVEVLEHDYSVLQAWDGVSSNALIVACRPL